MKIEGQNRYRRVVVDTGPLFTTLTLSYIRQSPKTREHVTSKHKPPPYILDLTSERLFLEFFQTVQSLLITSHVIGELKSRQRLGEQVQREFWRFSIGFLRNKLEEKLVRLIDLGRDATYEKLLYEVGPTDAGLISLAQKENCTLLTDDSRLLSWQRLDPHLHIELIKDVLHL